MASQPRLVCASSEYSYDETDLGGFSLAHGRRITRGRWGVFTVHYASCARDERGREKLSDCSPLVCL